MIPTWILIAISFSAYIATLAVVYRIGYDMGKESVDREETARLAAEVTNTLLSYIGEESQDYF